MEADNSQCLGKGAWFVQNVNVNGISDNFFLNPTSTNYGV